MRIGLGRPYTFPKGGVLSRELSEPGIPVVLRLHELDIFVSNGPDRGRLDVARRAALHPYKLRLVAHG